MTGDRRSEPSFADAESDSARHQLEQGLLLELSQAVSSTLDLEALLQIIADGTARLLEVETAAIYLIEDEKMFLGATTPPLDPNVPEGVRWGRCEDHPHIARVIASRQHAVVPDATQAELSPPERAIVEVRNLRTLLFLPFCHEGETIGVLILGTTTKARAFDDREVDLCRTLTNQLAMGVQNARLHQGLKQYALELETQMAEQVRLSEQLRQAQKMDAVGQLAGGVAHDFNNLLQVIHGFTCLATEETDPHSSAHESLGFVMQAAERASNLVRQLLAFGCRQLLNMKTVDVNETVDHLIPMLGPVLGERVVIERQRADDLLPVRADANQLEQILINLALNARDAMVSGGALTIRTSNVVADQELCAIRSLPAVGPYVLIEVEDTGCGMDAETKEKAFEPFFTTKQLGEGTGLGLSTVHGLVGQHHGAVQIVSEVGRGTTIELYLPAAAHEEAAASSERERQALEGNETILLAEDHDMVRKLTMSFLDSAGYSVLMAADGGEAVRLVAERLQDIDLAILDVVMPKLGGEEVLRFLRERRPEIPVIFATAYGAQVAGRSGPHEDVGLIQKPYAREELLRRVRDALDARK